MAAMREGTLPVIPVKNSQKAQNTSHGGREVSAHDCGEGDSDVESDVKGNVTKNGVEKGADDAVDLGGLMDELERMARVDEPQKQRERGRPDVPS